MSKRRSLPVQRTSSGWGSDQLLVYREHIHYEMEGCFLYAERLLSGRPLDRVQKNLAIDGFGIHLRALLEFFCRPTGGHDGDVRAVDYARGWQLTESDLTSDPSDTGRRALAEAWRRVNKEIGHLTTARKTDGDQNKDWKDLLFPCLEGIWTISDQFARAADPDKITPHISELVAKHKPVSPVGIISNATNSATTMTFTSLSATTSGSR